MFNLFSRTKLFFENIMWRIVYVVGIVVSFIPIMTNKKNKNLKIFNEDITILNIYPEICKEQKKIICELLHHITSNKSFIPSKNIIFEHPLYVKYIYCDKTYKLILKDDLNIICEPILQLFPKKIYFAEIIYSNGSTRDVTEFIEEYQGPLGNFYDHIDKLRLTIADIILDPEFPKSQHIPTKLHVEDFCLEKKIISFDNIDNKVVI